MRLTHCRASPSCVGSSSWAEEGCSADGSPSSWRGPASAIRWSDGPSGPASASIDRVLWVVVLGQTWSGAGPAWQIRADWPGGNRLRGIGRRSAASTLTHDSEVCGAQPLARPALDDPCRVGRTGWPASRGSPSGAPSASSPSSPRWASTSPRRPWRRSPATRAWVSPVHRLARRARFPRPGPWLRLNPAGNGILLGLGLAATLLRWPRLACVGEAGLRWRRWRSARESATTQTRTAGRGTSARRSSSAWRSRGGGGWPWLAGPLASVVVIVTQWDSLATFKRDLALSAEATADSAKSADPRRRGVADVLRPPLWAAASASILRRNPTTWPTAPPTFPGSCPVDVQQNVLLALPPRPGWPERALSPSSWGSGSETHGGSGSRPTRRSGPGNWGLVPRLAGNYLVNGMFQDVAKTPMIHMWPSSRRGSPPDCETPRRRIPACSHRLHSAPRGNCGP